MCNPELFIPNLVSSISTLIAATAVAVAVYYSHQTQKQYKESQKPQLSMRLDKFDYGLYLHIENTGETAATGIQITPISIENNGKMDQLHSEGLFELSFELYPNETVQAMVAHWGGNVSQSVFPSVVVDVRYMQQNSKKAVSYTRKVTFSKYFDNKVYADVNIDIRNLESTLNTTARATLRMANYLEGRHLAAFDELHVAPRGSLRNDLCSAVETADKKIIQNCTEAITEALRKHVADEHRNETQQTNGIEETTTHE